MPRPRPASALDPLHNPGAPIALKLGALELVAFSISGLATYVMVPDYDAVFDLGHCPLEAVRLRNVFLSHVHQDHAAGVVRHISLRNMFGAPRPRVYVPAESAAELIDVLRAFERMEHKPAQPLDEVVKGVAPGDVIALSSRLEVRVFDVVHRIASRGFTVVEKRQKLRAEWVGRPGAEIGAARARGETVSDVLEVNAFTYVGDSTIETLRRHPEVGQSEVLFLEATHLPGTGRDVSERYGHTHLEQLADLYAELPEAFASRYIVLKHWSTRYGRREILAAKGALPAGLRERVVLLV